MNAPIQLFPSGGPPPVEDLNPAEVMPAPSAPLDVARILLREFRQDDLATIRRWRGGWWRYRGPHWVEAETDAIRRHLYLRLEHAQYLAKDRNGQWEEKPWAPDKGKIDKLLDAMGMPDLLEQDVDAPCWIDTGELATGLIGVRNGLLDIATRTLQPMTPRYFGLVGVPFDYEPDAPEPTEWLAFLRSLWPQEGDVEADEVLTLQEWFGYVLSGRMDLQKILLLVGPPRSGKGTIARVLTALLGGANVAAPTLASLGTNFGLQPLLGRPLAIVGDARLERQGQQQVVERLLSISGEDMLTVDRKNRTAWSGRIPARFMILSNELPRFGDSSGAIATRFVVLTMRRSFRGEEDTGLEGRILGELSSILTWALDGLARLNAQRRITEPAGSREAVQVLADLVSTAGAFVREACVLDSYAAVGRSELFKAWQEWCAENGHHPSSIQKFSTDLRAAVTEINEVRPKVNGRAQPREWRGIGLDPEWVGRVKDLDPFQLAQMERDARRMPQ